MPSDYGWDEVIPRNAPSAQAVPTLASGAHPVAHWVSDQGSVTIYRTEEGGSRKRGIVRFHVVRTKNGHHEVWGSYRDRDDAYRGANDAKQSAYFDL